MHLDKQKDQRSYRQLTTVRTLVHGRDKAIRTQKARRNRKRQFTILATMAEKKLGAMIGY